MPFSWNIQGVFEHERLPGRKRFDTEKLLETAKISKERRKRIFLWKKLVWKICLCSLCQLRCLNLFWHNEMYAVHSFFDVCGFLAENSRRKVRHNGSYVSGRENHFMSSWFYIRSVEFCKCFHPGWTTPKFGPSDNEDQKVDPLDLLFVAPLCSHPAPPKKPLSSQLNSKLQIRCFWKLILMFALFWHRPEAKTNSFVSFFSRCALFWIRDRTCFCISIPIVQGYRLVSVWNSLTDIYQRVPPLHRVR